MSPPSDPWIYLPRSLVSGGNPGAELGALRARRRFQVPATIISRPDGVGFRDPITRSFPRTFLDADYTSVLRTILFRSDAVLGLTRTPGKAGLHQTVMAQRQLGFPGLPYLTLDLNGVTSAEASASILIFLAHVKPHSLFVTGDLESETVGIERITREILYLVFANRLASSP